jgi:hypothetical protein
MDKQLDSLLSKHLKRLDVPEKQWPKAKENLLEFGKNVLAIESTNNYQAINPKSGAKGGYQFLDNSIAPALTRLKRYVKPKSWMDKVAKNKDARTLTPEQQNLLFFADILEKTVQGETGRGDRYVKGIISGDKESALKMYYEGHHTDPHSQEGTTERAMAQFQINPTSVASMSSGGIVSNMYNPRQRGSADMVDKRQLTDYENFGGSSNIISEDQYYNRPQNPKTAVPRNRFPFVTSYSAESNPYDFFAFDRGVNADDVLRLQNARVEAANMEDERRILERQKAYSEEPKQPSGAPIEEFMGRDFVPHPSLIEPILGRNQERPERFLNQRQESPVQEFAANEAKLRQGMQQDSPNIRKYGLEDGSRVDKRMQETGETELQAVASLIYLGEIELETAEKALLNDPTVMDRDSARLLRQNNPEEYARVMKEQDQAQQLFFDRMRGRDADGYFPETPERNVFGEKKGQDPFGSDSVGRAPIGLQGMNTKF